MTNFKEWWKVNRNKPYNGEESAEELWNAAYNQGVEDSAKAMEHNSMHCAALIREIKK